jgi:hypothetical protein
MSVADLGMGGMENGALLGQGGQSEVNLGNGNGAPEYAVLKARALYSCESRNNLFCLRWSLTDLIFSSLRVCIDSASPDDPNEISFTKGEILDILDNSGKWWQARKTDNTKGIVPSNYLVLV